MRTTILIDENIEIMTQIPSQLIKDDNIISDIEQAIIDELMKANITDMQMMPQIKYNWGC